VTVAVRRDGRRKEKVKVVTPTERDELIRLRRENKRLRQERDLLSRAAAGSTSLPVSPGDRHRRWLARETGAVLSGSSNS
jgi:transposase